MCAVANHLEQPPVVLFEPAIELFEFLFVITEYNITHPIALMTGLTTKFIDQLSVGSITFPAKRFPVIIIRRAPGRWRAIYADNDRGYFPPTSQYSFLKQYQHLKLTDPAQKPISESEYPYEWYSMQ